MFNSSKLKMESTDHSSTRATYGSDGSVPVTPEERSSSSGSFNSLQSLESRDEKMKQMTGRHSSTGTISSTASSVEEFDGIDAIQRRIDTFFDEGWCQPISVKDLAEAGLRCIGRDVVVCDICGSQLSGWKHGDIPLNRHRKQMSSCYFVKYKRKMKKRKRRSKGLQFDSVPSGNDGSSDSDTEIDDEIYTSEFNRLMTFQEWPLASPVDKYDLAAAGFYRVSSSTYLVRCYACKVEVEDWDLGDRPKKKHEGLKPTCPHMKEVGNTENIPLHQSEKRQAVDIPNLKA